MKKRPWNQPVQRTCRAFSLVELMVAILILTIIVLGLGYIMGHGTVVSRTGNKHIDTDTQARAVLDRMAVDFAQMLKRTDIDYYVKGPGTYKGHGNGHAYGQKVSSYETIGPGVFRFEYYYLLKNGIITDVPWNTDAGHTSMAGIGLGDVEAIGVAIAVIDPAARALINAASATSLFDLASDLADFKSAHGRGIGAQKKVGDLEASWEGTLFGDPANNLPGIINTGQTGAGSPIPKAAVSAIRIYGRYFDLKTLPAL